MTVGLNVARDYCVGFLSMEMPHSDVRDRQAAILSRAAIGFIKRPAQGLDYDRIVDGVERQNASLVCVGQVRPEHHATAQQGPRTQAPSEPGRPDCGLHRAS